MTRLVPVAAALAAVSLLFVGGAGAAAPVGAIRALLLPPNTLYEALVADPDGNPLSYDWSETTISCGTFVAGVPTPRHATWEHPAEQCPHDDGFLHAGTIVVNVSDGTGNVIRCTYDGSLDGLGPACGAVDERSPTQTVLGSSPNPSTFGQPVTFTATVTDDVGTPTGTVCFLAGATELGTAILDGSGVANFTSSALDAGSHVIVAVYEGDSSFQASTSGTLLQVVDQASTSATLDSSANPSTFGQPVTFTATVTDDGGTPTGTVVFRDGAADLGTAPLDGDGQAAFTTDTLTVGTHAITAQYDGDPNFAGSTSAQFIQAVLDDEPSNDLDLAYFDSLGEVTDEIVLFDPSPRNRLRIWAAQGLVILFDELSARFADDPIRGPLFRRLHDQAAARLRALVPVDVRYTVAGPGSVDVQATLTSRNAAGDAIGSYPIRVTAQALNVRSGPFVPVPAGGRIRDGSIGGILFVDAVPGGSLDTEAPGYSKVTAAVLNVRRGP